MGRYSIYLYGMCVARQRELKLNFLRSQLLVTKKFFFKKKTNILHFFSIRNNKLDYFTSFLHKHTSTITIFTISFIEENQRALSYTMKTNKTKMY